MRDRTGRDAPEIIRGWLRDPAPDKGIHLADEDGGWIFYSYTDIAGRALRIAGAMREHAVRAGDGVCVILPTDVTCAAAFYAVWACGAVFTPITPPTFADLDEYTAHAAAILAQAAPALVVTAPGLTPLVTDAVSTAGLDVPVMEVGAAGSDATPLDDLAPTTECALLQFTSGSTGIPRGVEISWPNLATNTAMITDLLCWRADEPMASWLPLYHDMGLVGGFLTTVTNQEDLYLMRPDQFVRDPARWLRAMEIARHTPSPSFSLGYLAHRIRPDDIDRLDLSGWRTLAVGSEPVELSDLQSFCRLVAPQGFDPSAITLAYGLAESTLMVSSSRRDRPITLLRPASPLRFGEPVDMGRCAVFDVDAEYPGSGWIAGLGCSTPDSEVAVVDDDGRPVPDGVLGEVTVRGGSVARGYLAGSPAGSTHITDGVLHTGDAGFLHNAELYVLGRMGSSLQVRGRSVFMEDVESTVSVECGITKGKLAAVAITDAGSHGVALFAETAPGEWISHARTVIRGQLGPAQTVTVITGGRGLIRRTSSGKPRRRHMWQMFTAGEMTDAVVHEVDGTASAAAASTVASARETADDRAVPTLPAQRVAQLLDTALDSVVVPDNCAIVFEGSLAEGFGNEGSDVDFLVVAGGDEELPTLPTVLFGDGRRLEVRTRSLAQLRHHLETVADHLATGTVSELDEDLLNRCQRFLRSTTIRTSALVDLDELRAIIDHRRFGEVMARWWRHRAVAVLRHVTTLRTLGADDEAIGWMRDALVQAAKAWCAERGETYVETKWLPRQLDRIDDERMTERWTAATTPPTPDADSTGSWWVAATDLLAEIGIDANEWTDARQLRLARVPGVTTWTIGSRVHVVRGVRDVFVLSDPAAQAWRQMVFRRPVLEICDRGDRAGQAEHRPVAEYLVEFLRLGVVGVDWAGAGPIRPAIAMCEVSEPYTPPPATSGPIVGLGGAVAPPREGVAVLSPLPAERFASAGLQLTWANIVAENAREDLVGALKSGQGGVADVAAPRLIAMIARMVLSAWGVHPLPPDVTPAATLRRILPSPMIEPSILTVIERAAHFRFDDILSSGGDGLAELEVLDGLLGAVRALVGSDFPASFDSRDQWRRTLEIAYDWVRLGTHLEVRLPLAEAADLMNSGGGQPHPVADAPPAPSTPIGGGAR